MLKRYKWNLILTSIVTVLPVLVGLLLWDRLPEVMTTHWGADGVADGWSGKGFAVFFLPLFLLGMHWLMILLTVTLDKKNLEQHPKLMGILFWIFPVVSLTASGAVYATAFDVEFGVSKWMPVLFALLFIAMGNYLPKCRQNATLGIKLPWTFRSEENWNKTHRFGGWVWVLGGILLLPAVFLPEKAFVAVLVGVIFLIVLIPTLYSWLLYRKQVREGTLEGEALEVNTGLTRAGKIGTIFGVLILAFCVVILFVGEVDVTFGETSFTVDSVWWQPLEVEYDSVTEISYEEYNDPGARTFGFGSLRLHMGQFRSDTHGDHTRYAYVGADSCVVLTVEGKTLVLSGKDSAETREIYEQLLKFIEA